MLIGNGVSFFHKQNKIVIVRWSRYILFLNIDSISRPPITQWKFFMHHSKKRQTTKQFHLIARENQKHEIKVIPLFWCTQIKGFPLLPNIHLSCRVNFLTKQATECGFCVQRAVSFRFLLFCFCFVLMTDKRGVKFLLACTVAWCPYYIKFHSRTKKGFLKNAFKKKRKLSCRMLRIVYHYLLRQDLISSYGYTI